MACDGIKASTLSSSTMIRAWRKKYAEDQSHHFQFSPTLAHHIWFAAFIAYRICISNEFASTFLWSGFVKKVHPVCCIKTIPRIIPSAERIHSSFFPILISTAFYKAFGLYLLVTKSKKRPEHSILRLFLTC